MAEEIDGWEMTMADDGSAFIFRFLDGVSRPVPLTLANVRDLAGSLNTMIAMGEAAQKALILH